MVGMTLLMTTKIVTTNSPTGQQMHNQPSMEEVYEAGYDAYVPPFSQRPSPANPYPVDDPRHEQWNEGWMRAQQDY